MTKKSQQILTLTDAVIVIGAHEHNIWEPLCNNFQIALPATVLEDEVFYFSKKDNEIGLKPSEWEKKARSSALKQKLKISNA